MPSAKRFIPAAKYRRSRLLTPLRAAYPACSERTSRSRSAALPPRQFTPAPRSSNTERGNIVRPPFCERGITQILTLGNERGALRGSARIISRDHRAVFVYPHPLRFSGVFWY